MLDHTVQIRLPTTYRGSHIPSEASRSLFQAGIKKMLSKVQESLLTCQHQTGRHHMASGSKHSHLTEKEFLSQRASTMPDPSRLPLDLKAFLLTCPSPWWPSPRSADTDNRPLSLPIALGCSVLWGEHLPCSWFLNSFSPEPLGPRGKLLCRGKIWWAPSTRQTNPF